MTRFAAIEEIWEPLRCVEEEMYAGEHGVHAYTSLLTPEEAADDPVFAALVSQARINVEGATDLTGYAVEDEIARRVAAALAVLSFGSQHGAELAAKVRV